MLFTHMCVGWEAKWNFCVMSLSSIKAFSDAVWPSTLNHKSIPCNSMPAPQHNPLMQVQWPDHMFSMLHTHSACFPHIQHASHTFSLLHTYSACFASICILHTHSACFMHLQHASLTFSMLHIQLHAFQMHNYR